MSLLDNFLIAIFSRKIGEDYLGNKYYESKNCDYLGQVKRKILYKGEMQPSKIPPMWHAWLHYLIEDVPNDQDSFARQQIYLQNLAIINSSRIMKNKTSGTLYNRWNPPI